MNKCQQEFEKWADKYGMININLERHPRDIDSYRYNSTSYFFDAWCAAWGAALKQNEDSNNV